MFRSEALSYVYVFWDSSFRSLATGITDRGPYGYYEVHDFGTVASTGAGIKSFSLSIRRDQWRIRNRLTLNLGLRLEELSMRPSGATKPGHREFLDFRKSEFWCVGQGEDEGLRQLGAILRLDEIRTGLVNRRPCPLIERHKRSRSAALNSPMDLCGRTPQAISFCLESSVAIANPTSLEFRDSLR